MTCTKEITMTGYRVRYVDLRAPKPRATLESVEILDRDYIDSLARLGMNPADYIEDRFTRGGFHVLTVEKLPKRRSRVDLIQLWESAGQEVTSE